MLNFKMKCSLIVLTFTIFLLLFQIYPANKSKAYNIDKNSTYIWYTEESPDKLMKRLKKDNINKVYLYLHIDLLGINYYEKFIKQAIINGILIEPLNGDNIWIYNDEKLWSFLNNVNNINQHLTTKERIRTIHLDIEPYILTNYEKDRDEIILRYQNLILEIYKWCNKEKINVIYDIPDWYEFESYDNKYGHSNLLEFIIKNSNGINVMSYHDNAFGINGIYESIKKEIIITTKLRKKIEISIEVTPPYNGDSKISFYEEGYSKMEKELYLLKNNIKKNHNVNIRFAFHDFRNLEWLIQNRP